MICPDCGHKNRDNATFCVICGAQLSHADAFRATPLDELRPQKTEENLGTLRDGRYRILKKLGEGGMGRIYLTRDVKMDYLVVIKELLPIFVTQAERDYVEKRFTEEAKILFRLDYRGLPKVIDYFQDKGNMYIVMQYVEGENLSNEVKGRKQKQISIEECIKWMGDLLEILKYLHNQNPPIIHRDIKPKNIMLNNRNELFLVDFGLARTIGMHTHTGTSVGTYGYSSPEHYSGKFELSSDLFSIGATFHHLLSGDDPQNRDTFDYPKLKKYIPDFPQELQHIFDKLLDVRKSQRFQRVEFVQEALLEFKKHFEQEKQEVKAPQIKPETEPVKQAVIPPTAPLQPEIIQKPAEQQPLQVSVPAEPTPAVKVIREEIAQKVPEPAEIKRMSVVGLTPVTEEMNQVIEKEKPTVVPIEQSEPGSIEESVRPEIKTDEGDTPVAPPKKPVEPAVIPSFSESKTTAISLPPSYSEIPHKESVTTIQPVMPRGQQMPSIIDEDSFVVVETHKKENEISVSQSHAAMVKTPEPAKPAVGQVIPSDKSIGLTKLDLHTPEITIKPTVAQITPTTQTKTADKNPEPPAKVEIPQTKIEEKKPEPQAKPVVPQTKIEEKKPEPPAKVETPQVKIEEKKPEPQAKPVVPQTKIEEKKPEPPVKTETPQVKIEEKKPEPNKPVVRKPELQKIAVQPAKIDFKKPEMHKDALKQPITQGKPGQEPPKPVVAPAKIEQKKTEQEMIPVQPAKTEEKKPEPPAKPDVKISLQKPEEKPAVVKDRPNLQFKAPEKKAEQVKPDAVKQAIKSNEKPADKIPLKKEETVQTREEPKAPVKEVAKQEVKEAKKEEPVKAEVIVPSTVPIPEKAEPPKAEKEEKSKPAEVQIKPTVEKVIEKKAEPAVVKIEKTKEEITVKTVIQDKQTKEEKPAIKEKQKPAQVREEKAPSKKVEKPAEIRLEDKEFDEFSQEIPKPKSKALLFIPVLLILALLSFGIYYKISSEKPTIVNGTPVPTPKKPHIAVVPSVPAPAKSAEPKPVKTEVAVVPAITPEQIQEKTAFKVESGTEVDKVIFFDKSKKRSPIVVSIKDLKKNDPNAEMFAQDIEPGSYTVKFIRANYVDIKRDLELKAGNEINITQDHISWTKKPSLLVRTNLEANISVYNKADGKNMGKGKTTKGKDGKFSLMLENLDQSKYKIVANRSGYYEETKDNVNLVNGKTGEVNISLKEIPPAPREPAYKPPVYEQPYNPPPVYRPPVRPVDPITGH